MLMMGIRLLGALVVGFFASIYFAPVLIKLAHAFNFLDRPNGQLKNHGQPIPYAGGLVVYLGMLVSLMLFFPLKETNTFFLFGSTFLLMIGLIDDCISLSPFQKMSGQLLATICFVKGGLYLKEKFLLAYDHPLSYFIWMSLSSFWMLSIINGFNLIDVMDGLASVVALMASFSFLGMALLAGAYTPAFLLVALSGSLLGFLWYNKPPAKMYLGDAGALFIGGILGAAPFMIPWGTFSLCGYFIPVLILAIPLLEIGTLILIRTYLKIPFYNGSPHHFSHFFKARSWSIHQILAYTIAFSILLSMAGFLFALQHITFVAFVSLSLILVAFWYFMLLFSRIGLKGFVLPGFLFRAKRSDFFEKSL